MNRLAAIWKQKTTAGKVLSAIGFVCSLSVIVLAMLQLAGVWADAGFLYLPLLAVLMLIQAAQYRRKSRSTVILSLCAAAVILAAVALRLILR